MAMNWPATPICPGSGAVSLKTFTPAPRAGNPPERIAEVPAGVLNSIGLQNPGKDAFFAQTMPRVLAALERDQIVVSVGGDTIEDYVALCRETEARFGGRIAALELNAACPNVSHGAGFYSRDPQAARELVQAVPGGRGPARFSEVQHQLPQLSGGCRRRGGGRERTRSTPPILLWA